MKVIAVLLLVLGVLGVVMGLNMFGDIGIAALIGALTAILAGVGFFIVAKKITDI